MCLARPGRVVALEDNGKTAVVDYGGGLQARALNVAARARQGDLVLVQMKAVVDILSRGKPRAQGRPSPASRPRP